MKEANDKTDGPVRALSDFKPSYPSINGFLSQILWAQLHRRNMTTAQLHARPSDT